MASTNHILINKAYATPSLRQNILNKGMICLYCDYSGFVSKNGFGVGCCFVHNRTIQVTARKLYLVQDEGSDYGELLAILYSLEILTRALTEHQPKHAFIFTDCSRIEHFLSRNAFLNPHYEKARSEVLASMHHLKTMFPEVRVEIKYMSKHKQNNPLHRLAHNAAREAAN
ncbi:MULTISPECIES: hypothetical protein [Bacillales]|uniref:hypothetical protein n=1 Tax=Bacillales TaxID=1385 RepID=UPI0006A7C7B7|nr:MULTISPECIES: hypothetical protein [Bacillales]OBZ16714.1 hypothetical protein A7975_02035 [Bacillus sp. FJAT-26390]